MWPLRNYINHGELVVTKIIMVYQIGHQMLLVLCNTPIQLSQDDPQYTSIINNKLTIFPSIYENKDDSIKLERAIFLAAKLRFRI